MDEKQPICSVERGRVREKHTLITPSYIRLCWAYSRLNSVLPPKIECCWPFQKSTNQYTLTISSFLSQLFGLNKLFRGSSGWWWGCCSNASESRSLSPSNFASRTCPKRSFGETKSNKVIQERNLRVSTRPKTSKGLSDVPRKACVMVLSLSPKTGSAR